MTYENIVLGRFLARPNRFLAEVELEGQRTLCHVKNTSRLGELLIPGAEVSLQRITQTARKTAYDLIAVRYQERWVNIDSQAPNKVFGEWVVTSGTFGALSLLRPETRYGTSRFDFYLETAAERLFIEVKGVTLVEEGVARFPGAPTSRGVKHLQTLAQCMDEGYGAMMVFIAKREDALACAPNDDLDPAFGRALREAAARGVRLLALNCNVKADSLSIRGFIPVLL